MALGDNCSSACKTKDHASFGDCIRSKGLRVAYCRSAAGMDADTQKKWDAELDSYRSARAEGIQPQGTKQHQIDAAKAISDATGVAYQGGGA